jgi:hypothetical protein
LYRHTTLYVCFGTKKEAKLLNPVEGLYTHTHTHISSHFRIYLLCRFSLPQKIYFSISAREGKNIRLQIKSACFYCTGFCCQSYTWLQIYIYIIFNLLHTLRIEDFFGFVKRETTCIYDYDYHHHYLFE